MNLIRDYYTLGVWINLMNDKKTILAIETSSNICGISLVENGTCIDFIDEDKLKKIGDADMNVLEVNLSGIPFDIKDDELIEVGEIGTRPEGGITSPTYFIILNERPSIIGEKFTIKNTGNTPELWQALNNDELNWRVNAEIFFNLSSLTSGQENTLIFDFSKQG